MKNVQENEATRFCFALTLWPPSPAPPPLPTPQQSQGQWKWYKMLEVNGAYKHGRYERIWFNSLHVDTQTASQLAKHDSIYRSIWYSNSSKYGLKLLRSIMLMTLAGMTEFGWKAYKFYWMLQFTPNSSPERKCIMTQIHLLLII